MTENTTADTESTEAVPETLRTVLTPEQADKIGDLSGYDDTEMPADEVGDQGEHDDHGDEVEVPTDG